MGKPKDALREAETTLEAVPREPVTLALKAEAEAKLGQVTAAKADRNTALAVWHGDRAMLPGAPLEVAAR
jgi:hypothetical protein